MFHVVSRGGRSRAAQKIAESTTLKGGAYFDSEHRTGGSPLFGGKQAKGIKDKHVSGFVFIDGKEVAAMVECCHCHANYLPRRGSGTKRGFCLLCMGPTCGGLACHACVPYEKKMEMREQAVALSKVI